VWVPPWISHVECLWAEPSLEQYAERLTGSGRLITFDRRGYGLSDPLARRSDARGADGSWRFLLERRDALFRQALEGHHGREVKRTGDGVLATLDGPARAIRCAAWVAEAMGTLGLQIRAGLHTGELE
jgi:pimeloyl-ACP methyl ester carboxylesterase